ncbi:MAG: LPS export ABC transporter permease LptF [Gammaproteobacteria bacterium]|nr:LPS export ABC transporter permease LptF [Gammaproteobacteria bacterium]
MIIRRYLVKEIALYAGSILAALLLIDTSMRLAGYLSDAASGKIADRHILEMLGLKLALVLQDLVPLSVFLGTLAALSRLDRDLELVAIRSIGYGRNLVLDAALRVAAAGALVVAVLTLGVGPDFESRIIELKTLTREEATISGVRAGRFREIAGGKRVFYAERVGADQSRLEDAFAHWRKNNQTGVLRSDGAFLDQNADTGERAAVFVNGTSYEGPPGTLEYTITNFDRYAVVIDQVEGGPAPDGARYLSSTALLRDPSDIASAELQWRLGLPLATLVLAALAVYLAATFTGRSWYAGMVGAVALFFCYTNLLNVGRALVKNGTISGFPGLWWVHVVFVALLAVFAAGERGLLTRRKQAEPATG